MGFAKIGSTIETSWKITNEGDNTVDVKLVPLLADNSTKISLSSDVFSLQSKENKSVKITLVSTTAGTVEGSI